jgi:hypothetical protein
MNRNRIVHALEHRAVIEHHALAWCAVFYKKGKDRKHSMITSNQFTLP